MTPIAVTPLVKDALAELAVLGEFEIRIAAAQDDGGTWTELSLWTLYDAINDRGLSEIQRPGEAFDHDYFGAVFLGERAAVFEMTLLGVNVFPDEIRGPTPAELEIVRTIDPIVVREHLGTVLNNLAPALRNGEAAQFGVITRVDANLPADQALDIVPVALRTDLALHVIHPDQLTGTIPLTVAFDDGRLSSVTFVLDLLVDYLDSDLPSDTLTLRMEIVRNGELLESLLGDAP